MKQLLKFKFEQEKTVSFDVVVELKLDEKLEDIVEYFYEKKFGCKFRPIAYRLDPEAIKFVKDIEDKWWNNKLDTLSIYQDIDFKDWLREKYYEQALNKIDIEDDVNIYQEDLYYEIEI